MLAHLSRFCGYTLSITLSGTCIAGIGYLIWQDIAPHVPDRREPTAQEVQDRKIRELFAEVDAITFFIKRPMEFLGPVIITGAEFATPENVADRQPERLWCYVNIGGGELQQRLDLGERTGSEAPTFTDLDEVPETTLRAAGLTRAGLREAARENCVFDGFDPRDATS